MELNEIRFYLHRFDNLKREVKHLQEALEAHKNSDETILKAQVLTGMPTAHNVPDSRGETWDSRTQEEAIKRAEYSVRLAEEIESKLKLIRAVESVYFYLREPKLEIFELRYMVIPQGRAKYSWYEIASETGETEDYCKKIDGRILRKIQQKQMKL